MFVDGFNDLCGAGSPGICYDTDNVFFTFSQGFFRAFFICMLHDFKFPSTIPTAPSGSAARKDA